MSRQVVYIACAEGEESQADLLAEPLRRAGYEVEHNGTITVGESKVGEAERALASGSPIVLCVTRKAAGSAEAIKISNAAHMGGGPVRVFPVQMEKEAYVAHLAFGGKVARYCDDPRTAINDLLGALAKHFPALLPDTGQAKISPTAADSSYLDRLTDATIFDFDALGRYRALLRREFSVKYPSTLIEFDFLGKLALLVDGRLTRTGVLLFGANPSAYVPTAIVKCTYYHGIDRGAEIWDDETLEGTVPSQIEAAGQFVKDRALIGEVRSADQPQSVDEFDLPMVAVYEVIANALVHRDYESSDSNVHIRLYTDRLEVSSPGTWQARELNPDIEYSLSSLEGHSVKRNFRLAYLLSAIRFVEGDGRGIRAAVVDCERMNSPPPVVLADGRFVTVTFRRMEPVTVGKPAGHGRLDAGPPDSGSSLLYVWTAADSQAGLEVVNDPGERDPIEPGEWVDVAALRQGRLPNLQLEFRQLRSAFDQWLIRSPPRKRGMERLRVLWLAGDPGPERSKALLACLSRAGQQGRAVYDASRDLSLAAETLGRSILAADSGSPPLISVDLREDEPASPWRAVEAAVTNAGKQLAGRDGRHRRGDDPYPRMIVAGTMDQSAAAAELLAELADIMPVDRRGTVQQRPSTLTEQIPTSEHVYNRGLPITARPLFGRRREIETLRQDWESEQIRVLSVVAYGGTGKSSLVNAWLHEMQERDYGGADKVFAWSFYSQGTKENLVSADLFVSTALSWLGDESSPNLNLWERGLRLASLIKQHKFLLVLDGLEPLQYPMSSSLVGGQLTDDSIRALLEELAKPDWEGLCLITTRVPLTDLNRFQADHLGPAAHSLGVDRSEDHNLDQSGSVAEGTVDRLNLENLGIEDAADLLEHLIRTEADYTELKAAVREVDCHALAITLLGNYLRDVHGGDLSGRFYLDRLTVEVHEGGHARRVMATYTEWLEHHERSAELTVLRLIGLFDRPADPDAMVALLSDRQMRTFTGELEQGGDVWNNAVDALREMGLLNREFPDQPGTLDAHPLVREHFRDQLHKEYEDWWLQGNRTLFRFYQTQAPERPDNSRDMNALYAAVTHGCAAGLHQQVFDEVLLQRVWRDRRTNFSTRRLGMTGSDLVALSNYFYPQQWTVLRTPSLSTRARVLVLTNAGVRLRQLGRLVDARDCFGAVVREIDPRTTQPEELEDASYAAAQYCELLVIAGKLKGDADESAGALFNGWRAVEYSDRGSDAYFSMHSRSSLAEVYFMLNDQAQADALFEQAMSIERERHPRPPFLYSQSLFRYGYFLIETGRAEILLQGAADDPSWGRNSEDSSLLSDAIRLLILGAAHRALVEAGNRTPAFLSEGEKILDDALSAFQIAGYADYTVRGLLERAHFYRALRKTRYHTEALADLARAAAEAKRGRMDLLYADVLLQQVACYLDVWPVMTRPERLSIKGRITDGLKEATRLIATIGYGRRQAMLASLQEAAGEAGALG
jgi:tetratricopeptide (TPR) repeat protein